MVVEFGTFGVHSRPALAERYRHSVPMHESYRRHCGCAPRTPCGSLTPDDGAERAAIAYTILGSCRLADVDALEYLRDVLPRLTRKVRLLELSQLLRHAGLLLGRRRTQRFEQAPRLPQRRGRDQDGDRQALR